MKQLYKFLFLFLIYPNLIVAQNLVPNPSFEDTVACPTGAGQIYNSTGWFSAKGSPDYFHSCANQMGPYFGVPTNVAGYQNAYNGAAYIGIGTYSNVFPNIREYVGIELLQPLLIGSNYVISAYISWAGEVFGGESLDCKTNKFGFKLSTVKYDPVALIPAPTDNFAHVFSDDIITDSTHWVQIYGSFTADSAYTHLYIGNFFDDLNTNVNPCLGSAYYYIDNICFSKSAIACGITANFPSIKEQVLQLYPNPANNSLAIKGLTGGISYSIFNSSGNSILKGYLIDGNNDINTSSFPNGIYFILLNNNAYKFFISH